MENTGNKQPQNSTGYQRLGEKAFWLFFLQISPIALVFLLISIILLALSLQPLPTDTFFSSLQKGTLGVGLFIFAVSIVIFAVCFAVARLSYINYLFAITDDSLKIKKGILNKTENAIPYRQIQNVDIERDIIFRMMGLSRLVILTAGHEDEKSQRPKTYLGESEGIIPAIDQKLAEYLQAELLRRANVQKVTSQEIIK